MEPDGGEEGLLWVWEGRLSWGRQGGQDDGGWQQSAQVVGPGSHSSRSSEDQQGPGWLASSQQDGENQTTGGITSLVGWAWAGQGERMRWVDWSGWRDKMESK